MTQINSYGQPFTLFDVAVIFIPVIWTFDPPYGDAVKQSSEIDVNYYKVHVTVPHDIPANWLLVFHERVRSTTSVEVD